MSTSTIDNIVNSKNWQQFKRSTDYYDSMKKINESSDVKNKCKEFSKKIFNLVINWTDFWNNIAIKKNPSYSTIEYKQSVYNFFYKKKNPSTRYFWSGQVYNSIEKTPDEVFPIVQDILLNGKGNLREQIYLWELFYTDCYFPFSGENKGADNEKREAQRFGEHPGIFWTIILWVSLLIEEETNIPDFYKQIDGIKDMCKECLTINNINVMLTIKKIEFIINFLGVNNIFDVINMDNIDNTKKEIILESGNYQNFPSICHYSRPFPILKQIVHDISPKLREFSNFNEKDTSINTECKNENECPETFCTKQPVQYYYTTRRTSSAINLAETKKKSNKVCINKELDMKNLPKKQQIKIIKDQISNHDLKSVIVTDKNNTNWIVDIDDEGYFMNENKIPSYTNDDLMSMNYPLGLYEKTFLGCNDDRFQNIPWDIGQHQVNVNKKSFFYRSSKKNGNFLVTGVSGHSWLLMDVLSNFEDFNLQNTKKKLLLGIISYLMVPLHHTYYEIRWGTDYIGIPFNPKLSIGDDIDLLLNNTVVHSRDDILNISISDIALSDTKDTKIKAVVKEISEYQSPAPGLLQPGGKKKSKKNKKIKKIKKTIKNKTKNKKTIKK